MRKTIDSEAITSPDRINNRLDTTEEMPVHLKTIWSKTEPKKSKQTVTRRMSGPTASHCDPGVSNAAGGRQNTHLKKSGRLLSKSYFKKILVNPIIC